MGLPYPAGPLVDKHAHHGDPHAFALAVPAIPGLDFSFSGIKTSFLYAVRQGEATDPSFSMSRRDDLCASLQRAIIDHLLAKARRAMRAHGQERIGIAGGVAANSGLRMRLQELGTKEGWQVFVPPLAYCTDNAAMIALAGAERLEKGLISDIDVAARPRWPLDEARANADPVHKKTGRKGAKA